MVVGPALTVKARPGDNLMAMKVIDLAQPGDVIVISSDGEANLSVWGGIMSMMAAKRGIAGVVTDGVIRDVAQCRRGGSGDLGDRPDAGWPDQARAGPDQPADELRRRDRPTRAT